jgi:creatinine amidohydrolase/Fe(II)-dependent formamide hydrolase-like protein
VISRTFPLILGVWLVASAAQAEAPQPLSLEALTSPELAAAIRSGKTTIIVPIGGTEQNGAHMVLGKHNRRVKIFAERIAAALGNALVAPVIAYVPEGSVDPPSAHMRFPGTITVPDDAFEKTLESAARSFRLAGFRDVVFIGDHGDYQKNLQIVAQKLNRAWNGTPARAHAIVEYYQVAESGYARMLKSEGYRDDEIGTHAGLADTSLALAVDPGLVRAEKLKTGAPPPRAEGTYGDPRRATAELGQKGVDAIVVQTVDAIRKATVRQ